MSDDRRYRDEEWLREQYCELGKTSYEIAEMCGRSQTAISYWLNKHGIETPSGAPTPDPRLKNEEWLREQYCELGKTSYEIAEMCGCCSDTVSNWLDRHGVETRSPTSTPDPRLKNEEWLREQYCELGKSTNETAEVCGCSQTTVLNWLEKHRIETRPPAPSGENHCGWSGGPQPYGPGWTEQKRRTVRERDGFECVRCGISQSDHKDEHGMKLHVHHIKKAREVDNPEQRNAVENLVTLCRDCHHEYEQFADALQPQLSVDAD